MELKKNLSFNLVQNIFVGLAVTVTVTLLTTGFTSYNAFLISFLKAYFINFLAYLLIPTDKLAMWTCKKIKSSNALINKVINVLYCDIAYVTVISVVMFIWELGITSIAFQVWKSVYAPLLLVGFVVGFLTSPISLKIANSLIKEK